VSQLPAKANVGTPPAPAENVRKKFEKFVTGQLVESDAGEESFQQVQKLAKIFKKGISRQRAKRTRRDNQSPKSGEERTLQESEEESNGMNMAQQETEDSRDTSTPLIDQADWSQMRRVILERLARDLETEQELNETSENSSPSRASPTFDSEDQEEFGMMGRTTRAHGVDFGIPVLRPSNFNPLLDPSSSLSRLRRMQVDEYSDSHYFTADEISNVGELNEMSENSSSSRSSPAVNSEDQEESEVVELAAQAGKELSEERANFDSVKEENFRISEDPDFSDLSVCPNLEFHCIHVKHPDYQIIRANFIAKDSAKIYRMKHAEYVMKPELGEDLKTQKAAENFAKFYIKHQNYSHSGRPIISRVLEQNQQPRITRPRRQGYRRSLSDIPDLAQDAWAPDIMIDRIWDEAKREYVTPGETSRRDINVSRPETWPISLKDSPKVSPGRL